MPYEYDVVLYPREDESRLAFKMDFLAAVETRYRALIAAGRAVVLCGDWNVVPSLIDAAYAQDTGVGMGGVTAQRAFIESSPSRTWLARQLIDGIGAGWSSDGGGGSSIRFSADVEVSGSVDGEVNNRVGGGSCGDDGGTHRASGFSHGGALVDVFRCRYPRLKGAYTCWNVSSGAQLTNYGSRIDYFLMDAQSAACVSRAGIAPAHQGSDHAPIFITLQSGLLIPSFAAEHTTASTRDCSSLSSPSSPPPLPLASSVMLARAGRQGRLDGFFISGRPAQVEPLVGTGTWAEGLGQAGYSGLPQAPEGLDNANSTPNGGRGNATRRLPRPWAGGKSEGVRGGVAKRKAVGEARGGLKTRSGGAATGGNVGSIKSFFMPR